MTSCGDPSRASHRRATPRFGMIYPWVRIRAGVFRKLVIRVWA
jgi:hypothetical protein